MGVDQRTPVIDARFANDVCPLAMWSMIGTVMYGHVLDPGSVHPIRIRVLLQE